MKNIPIAFENTYSQLPDSFFSKALPEKSSNPQLIAWNEELALRLGIDSNLLTDETKASIFSGNLIVEESVPLAMVYAGHQFGHFSPRLGDGRALLLGELVGSDGKRYDVQLKGSGRNTFSRGGDGRSPLGPVLREYLLSEAMHALGVSTSRALAAVETGDFIYRDSCLQSAVFTRVAVSLIRVGSFEYFAARGDKENLLILLKYATNRMFPEIKDKANLAYFFLSEVITRQAQLIAHWMSLGFIHGVMNTDNFSVAAITIDYGPCAFLDEFQFHKVFSSIDHQSRYSYANQPNIALWNLTKLAESLFILFETPKQETIQLIESSLQAFISIYERQWLDRMRKKLGILERQPEDKILVQQWLNYLDSESLDFTLSFRNLSQLYQDPLFSGEYKKTEAFERFKKKWLSRLENQDPELTVAEMNRANPFFIPRNHLIESAISQAYQGDYSLFHELNRLFQNPFESQKERLKYALPPKDSEIVFRTFCGT